MIDRLVVHLGPSKDVQSLYKSVIQNEHHSCEPPSPFTVPKEHLAQVTYISNLRMAKTELPSCQTGIENDSRDNNGKNETRDKAKNRVRIGE